MNTTTAVQSIVIIIQVIRSLVKATNWSEVLVVCTRHISEGILDARVLFYTGLAHWKLGDRNVAVGYFNMAIQADPNFDHAPYANTCIALTYRRMARQPDGTIDQVMIQTAMGFFYRALELDPTGHYGDHVTSIAGCLALRGELEQSVEWYNWALANGCHRREECLYNRGMCLHALGRREEAHQTFIALVAMHPDNGNAQLWLARYQLNMDSSNDSVSTTIEAAIAGLTADLEMSESDTQHPRPVYVLRPNQHAVLHEEDSLGLAATNLSEAHGLSAIVCARRGDWDKTESAIRSSRRYDQNSRLVHQALRICRDLGEGGSEWYARLTKETGTHPGRLGVAVDRAGCACQGNSGQDSDSSDPELDVSALSLFEDESDFDVPCCRPSDSDFAVACPGPSASDFAVACASTSDSTRPAPVHHHELSSGVNGPGTLSSSTVGAAV